MCSPQKLKNGPMKTVKADKALKSVWAAGRRQITPKIGQLTNDAQTINRIVRKPSYDKTLWLTYDTCAELSTS